jgi:hypothetical protein
MTVTDDDFDGHRPFLNRPLPGKPSPVREEESKEVPVVRAYMMTGGRTSVGHVKLEFETMVSLSGQGRLRLPQLLFEQAKIGHAVSDESLSVAELAVKLRVPIGVAQVLCADMLHAELLEQHATVQNLSEDVSLLTRLINGVRAL